MLCRIWDGLYDHGGLRGCLIFACMGWAFGVCEGTSGWGRSDSILVSAAGLLKCRLMLKLLLCCAVSEMWWVDLSCELRTSEYLVLTPDARFGEDF